LEGRNIGDLISNVGSAPSAGAAAPGGGAAAGGGKTSKCFVVNVVVRGL